LITGGYQYSSDMAARIFTVPAAEASRRFSELLRAAREGVRITITYRGKPVAELSPVKVEAHENERRRMALADLVAHLATVTPLVVGPWTRDELCERH
jgi:prevent-host-death family protein